MDPLEYNSHCNLWAAEELGGKWACQLWRVLKVEASPNSWAQVSLDEQCWMSLALCNQLLWQSVVFHLCCQVQSSHCHFNLYLCMHIFLGNLLYLQLHSKLLAASTTKVDRTLFCRNELRCGSGKRVTDKAVRPRRLPTYALILRSCFTSLMWPSTCGCLCKCFCIRFCHHHIFIVFGFDPLTLTFGTAMALHSRHEHLWCDMPLWATASHCACDANLKVTRWSPTMGARLLLCSIR